MLIAVASMNSWVWQADFGWSWTERWGSMDWIIRGIIIVLGVMLAYVLHVLADRMLRYAAARRRSRRFARDARPALADVRVEDVLAIARAHPGSHLANITTAGVEAFQSVPSAFSDSVAIDFVTTALRRSTAQIHAELKLGLGTLATIAAVAPFVGMLGTVFGLLDAFRGVAMQKDAARAMIAESIAAALITTAAGLIVAVLAVWFRNYLNSTLAVFDAETSNASLELIGYLRTHADCRRTMGPAAAPNVTVFTPGRDRRGWGIPYDRQFVLLLSVWAFGLYFLYLMVAGWYWEHQREAEYAREHQGEITEDIAEQVSVSPDRRLVAVVPAFTRRKEKSDGREVWNCWSQPVMLRDGTEAYASPSAIALYPAAATQRTWKCGSSEYPSLYGYELVVARDCKIVVPTWLTNDDLIVQCADCSEGDVELRTTVFRPARITTLGLHGRVLHPRVIETKNPPCNP